MRFEQRFTLPFPATAVWSAMRDAHLVTACLPGAEIVEDRGGDEYLARFRVKLGPFAAAFDGELSIVADDEAMTGAASGRGVDGRSSSRARGALAYRVAATPDGAAEVVVDADIALAGALAQFDKAGVLQQIAKRLTAQFVGNLEGRLGAAQT